MKKVMSLCLLLLALGCGEDDQPEAKGPALQHSAFVLVHGAWNGAWVWDDVAAGLRADGARVTVVELPAHGSDVSALSGASLTSYVDTVTAALDAQDGPVVLVGHSLGGIVISQAAEQRPSAIARLVYLAAFVPKTGESLLDIALTDADSKLGAALAVDMDQGVAAVDPSQLTDIFCGECSRDAKELLTLRYRDEPLLALTQPVMLSAEGWGSVPKYFIYTAADRVISPMLQQRMTADLDFRDTATVESGHSPFLTVPSRLVETLRAFALE